MKHIFLFIIFKIRWYLHVRCYSPILTDYFNPFMGAMDSGDYPRPAGRCPESNTSEGATQIRHRGLPKANISIYEPNLFILSHQRQWWSCRNTLTMKSDSSPGRVNLQVLLLMYITAKFCDTIQWNSPSQQRHDVSQVTGNSFLTIQSLQ